MSFWTDDVPQREAVERWDAALAAARLGLTASTVEGPFWGGFQARDLGVMLAGEFRTSRAEIARTSRDVARANPDGLILLRQAGAEGSLFRRSDGEEFLLRPGDLMIVDGDQPFATTAIGQSYDYHAWILPRRLLAAADLGEGDVGRGVRLSRRRQSARMITSLFAGLERAASEIGAGGLARGVEAGLSLVAGALGGRRA